MITKQTNVKALDVDVLYRRVFVFVLDTIEFTEILKKHKKESIATELLQITTHWGESINEVRNIKELPVLKSKIEKTLLEADKIKYWLNLCRYSNCCQASVKLLSKLDNIIEQMKNIEIIDGNKLCSLITQLNYNVKSTTSGQVREV